MSGDANLTHVENCLAAKPTSTKRRKNTPSSRIDQLVIYRLQLVRQLSHCASAKAGPIRAEIALVDCVIGECCDSKQMILVVDDVPRMAATLVEMLGDSGYVAFSAPIGDAVSLAADLFPDLAVIDAMLLGKDDGVEIARQLHKSVPHMKLLLLSRYAGAGEFYGFAARELQPVVFDSLEKFVPPEELLTTIEELLSRPDSGSTGKQTDL